jgi:hypothetical protein
MKMQMQMQYWVLEIYTVDSHITHTKCDIIMTVESAKK